MRQPPPLTFARFVSTPENRSALAAVHFVAAALVADRPDRLANPLLLHGPAGTGKTHLVWALVAEVTRQRPDLTVAVLAANELLDYPGEGKADSQEPLTVGQRDGGPAIPVGPPPGKQECLPPSRPLAKLNLLIVEDLQHLPERAAEPLVQIIDSLEARQCPVVCTALAGPRHLPNLSARLANRLAGGLIIGLEPLSASGRLAFLQDKAQRRQLAVSHPILAWLAEHLTGGGRQLEGAISRLEVLARLHHRPLDLATVGDHFREQVEAGRPTVERIAQRVGGYFRVQPRQLQSRRRSRQVLLPRQVGMYLARQLTGLSLEQIGAYFGGRDHSTVLHACRKVETALTRDEVLGGAVRQLHAELA
jgi:chromosomal replication initiator protein